MLTSQCGLSARTQSQEPGREEENVCRLSFYRSVHHSFLPLSASPPPPPPPPSSSSSPLSTEGSAQSMQFSNHPKEDSVEHVVISREDAEMEAGREELRGGL